jgi:hypothetical protein
LVETRRSVVAPLGRGPGTIETFCSIIEPAPPLSSSPMPGEANSLTSMKLVAALPSTTIACALPFEIVTTSPTATGNWLGKQSLAPQRRCTLINPSEIFSALAGLRKSRAPGFSALVARSITLKKPSVMEARNGASSG